jgi:hypothetical protein
MKRSNEFNFDKFRRVTAQEVESARKAIEKKLNVKRAVRGRPPKAEAERFRPIHIRLNPLALKWARQEAHKRHTGYQTIINETLLEHSHQ